MEENKSERDQLGIEIWKAKKGFMFFEMFYRILFTVCIAICSIGFLAFILPVIFAGAGFPDIIKDIGIIFTFDGESIAALGGGSDHGAAGVASFGAIAFFVLLILAVLLRFLMYANRMLMTEKMTAKPLLQGFDRGFLLCDEGIYTRRVKDTYQLRPWGTLSLYNVDGICGNVILKAGGKLLVLGVNTVYRTGWNFFGGLKDIVMSHLSPEKRVLPARKMGLKWWVFAIVLGVLVITDIGLSSYYSGISKGAVGDKKCDICGESLVPSTIMMPDIRLQVNQSTMMPEYVTSYYPVNVPGLKPNPFYVSDGNAVVDEYCENHGYLYQLIHPDSALKVLLQVIEGKAGTQMLVQSMTSIIIWFFAIFIAFACSARKQEKRTI